jgi:hypothetical protein
VIESDASIDNQHSRVCDQAHGGRITLVARRRLTIVQAALGGVILANGIDGHGWIEITIGGAMILLAIADGAAERKPRLPASGGTIQRTLRYFGLR